MTSKALQAPKRRSRLNRLNGVDYAIMAFLALFALIILYPFYNSICVSLVSQADYIKTRFMLYPKNITLESYFIVFENGSIFDGMKVTIFITLVGVVYNMLLTVSLAYGFSKQFPGRKFFLSMIVFTMYFSGGLIPFYLTVGDVIGLNNLASLIIPFGINTFNMIVLRNFFNQVPNELIESCYLDGASDFRVLWQFVIPLSKAGIATVSLFYIVAKWDDWYWPSILLTRRDDLYPLALELRNVLNNSQSEGYGDGGIQVDPTLLFSQGQNAAMIVVSILPILCIYPWLQKYFVKGVMIGSIKS